jgi:DNA helicase-4
MANDFQKTKMVQAKNSDVTDGVVELIAFEQDENLDNGPMAEIERLVDEIAQDLLPPPPDDPKARKTSIFILGRYGLDHMWCLGNEHRPAEQRIEALATRHAAVLDICYKTAHRSKGLEADYVFCVGLDRAKVFNFPSTFDNDPLLQMLLPQRDTYPYAEDRRLFYVALTRARHKVYLMFGQRTASPFIVELMSPQYWGRVQYRGTPVLPRRCPTCHHGYLLVKDRRDGRGQFIGCSRYSRNPAKSCHYTDDLPA